MERFVTDERTGLKYELVGDYYLIAGEDEPEEDQPIGVWGQRHLRHLKRHRIHANSSNEFGLKSKVFVFFINFQFYILPPISS